MLLLVLAAFLPTVQGAGEGPRRQYSVSSGDAAATLRQFVEQSGEQVIYLVTKVRGVQTNPVSGVFTAREVLERMVANTALVVVQDERTGALMVRRAAAPPPETAPTDPPSPPQKNMTSKSLPTRIVGWVALSLASLAPGAETVPSPGQKDHEETVTMSPFEVVSDNRGYYASNTLSGTRFNAKLEDLGASISVVTKQQILDFATLDINDIFLYEANTEGTGNFTSFDTSRNGEIGDTAQMDPQNSNRIRGVAAANIARGNYASNSRIPIDPYNSDGVEISRGPNSNIFGLGNSAGTVNVLPSRALLTKPITQLTLRGDSYGGYRSSIDLNRPIWGKKLALRVLALYDSKRFTRKPSADITRRQQGMITFEPFKNTTIRASYEGYTNYARRPNSITPRDVVSYWKANGQITWDPVTFTAKRNGVPIGTYTSTLTTLLRDTSPLPLSLWEKAGFHNRPSMFVDGGKIAFWTVNDTNASDPTLVNGFTDNRYVETGTDILRKRATTMPLFISPGIADKSLYDWDSVNFTAPNYYQDTAKTANVEIEQFFVRTPEQVLAAQLGWFYESSTDYQRNIINATSSYLFVDVNERLLDGTPNPYFLRPYLGTSEPSTVKNTLINDTVRAQLVYQLDLSKRKGLWSWLGKNSVSGYIEKRLITTGIYRYREAVTDDHTWINPANRANSGFSAGRAYFRYYLGDNQGQNIDYAPPAFYGVSGTYNLYWYNGQTKKWISEPARFELAGYTPSMLTRQEIRTRGLVGQSSLLSDRLVATFGWRRDNNRARDSVGAVLDASTGLVDYDQMEDWLQWVERSGMTTTKGAVFRPFRGTNFLGKSAAGSGVGSVLSNALRSLNFHYNQSDSFQPVTPQYSLFGELLPNPAGKGKDYGVSVDLFGGKLIAKLNWYRTDQINTPKGDTGTIATRVIRIDTGRGPGGRDSPPFNLEEWAWDVVAKRHGLNVTAINLVRNATPAATALAQQYQSEVDKIMGVDHQFIENFVGRSIAETQDITARGLEFELNYNPNRFWSLKLAGAQQKAVDSNVSPNIQRYIDLRMPVWLAVKNDQGVPWWTSTDASTFYAQQVNGPLKTLLALQGKARSQVREWRFNLSTRYDLSGITEQRWLRNLTVGGAARWEDKGSIGYLGAAPDSDGVIRSLDVNKPVWDPARTYFDLFASYRLKLFSNRVGARVQLNVRNAFEGGRLQAVGVNPDGQPHTFRIVDPRQFILTTTFDL